MILQKKSSTIDFTTDVDDSYTLFNTTTMLSTLNTASTTISTTFNSIFNTSVSNLETENTSQSSTSNVVIAGAVAGVLSALLVFAIVINRRKNQQDTTDGTIKKDSSDTDSVSSNSSINKRGGHIFDKSYEDAQGYLVPTHSKRPKYSVPDKSEDNEDTYYEVGDIVNPNQTVYTSASNHLSLDTTYNDVYYSVPSNEEQLYNLGF